MIKAWRRPDGKYLLEFTCNVRPIPLNFDQWCANLAPLGGVWIPEHKKWLVTERLLARLGDCHKMYGVVAGPSSCGCEPAGFRWVTESEVEAGRTKGEHCQPCSKTGVQNWVRCDIIDVCGEADEAESIYASEFAHKIGALT